MAENEGLRVTGEAIVLSLIPDFCKTPPSMAPVPYQILGRFSDGVRFADNVCMTGMNVMTMDSRLSTVYGDEAGTGGGVRSGVNKGWCRPISAASVVSAKGHRITFHTSFYWMNCAGPDGPGNTIGRVTYVENINDVYIGPLGQIEGDTCPPVAPEEEKEESWWDKAAPWVHGALDVVGMIPGVGEFADLANAGIYLAEGDYGNAAMSAMGAIPLVGNLATAAKVAKAVDKAADVAKVVDKASDAAKAVDKASDAVKAVDKVSDASKAVDKASDASKAVDGVQVTKRTKKIGGETQATARGRQAHKEWDPGPGYVKEKRLDSGKRADAVNFSKREVVELKPNNPKAIRRGQKQVEKYRQELEQMTPGETWTSRVETYDP